MRAIILAAGFGRRMMPLTADMHKCLLTVGGQTVLARIIDALANNNITDLTIVTGYHAAELKAFMLGRYPQYSVQWVHNPNYETTNNIYSLSLALENISGEDVVLIECDLIFDSSIITKLIQSEHDAVALLSAYEPGMDGTVVSLSRDVITAIHPPHLQGEQFIFSDKFKTLNIYKFSRSFVDKSLRPLTNFYARTVNDNCYYELVLGVMIYMQSNEIHGLVVDTGLWSEIDDPIDLQSAEYKFNPAKRLEILTNSHGGYWNYPVEDFSFVQNAYFPNDGMYSMMRHHLPLLTKSFGSSQTDLDRKLSYFIETPPERLVALNGSSQIFPWLATLLAGKRVLIPDPTFGEYQRMFPDAWRYLDQVGLDIDKLESRVQEVDAAVIVNPNNPTGSGLATQAIFNLVLKYSDKLFIVDESFIDFSDQPSLISVLGNHPQCKNVLVIKSLGKCLGVPGLRTGFAFSNDESMLHTLRHSLPIWNMNAIAEYFLELLLKNRRYLSDSFSQVKKARQWLSQELRALPCIAEVFPSQANFLLVRADLEMCPPEGLVQALLQKYGILVKDASNKFNLQGQFLRLAVKRAEHNERLVKSLHELSVAAKKTLPRAN